MSQSTISCRWLSNQRMLDLVSRIAFWIGFRSWPRSGNSENPTSSEISDSDPNDSVMAGMIRCIGLGRSSGYLELTFFQLDLNQFQMKLRLALFSATALMTCAASSSLTEELSATTSDRSLWSKADKSFSKKPSGHAAIPCLGIFKGSRVRFPLQLGYRTSTLGEGKLRNKKLVHFKNSFFSKKKISVKLFDVKMNLPSSLVTYKSFYS